MRDKQKPSGNTSGTIRLSGKPLGRARERTQEETKQQRQDKKDRIPIEGKFGNAKRKGTLQRVMAKPAVTSRAVMTIGLITLNLDMLLKFLRALIHQWRMSQAQMAHNQNIREIHCTRQLRICRVEQWRNIPTYC